VLSLRQLEYFVAVVDEGSFTTAADVLGVSQPALSQQIRALERSIESPLFERLGRSNGLTPVGRAMLPHARAALSDTRNAERAAQQAARGQSGELRIGTVYSVAYGVLPRVLRAWRQSHPGVQVRLLEFRNFTELAAVMTAGEADLAIGTPPPGWTGPVAELGTEDMLVVLPPNYQPADAGEFGAGRVRLATLADEQWVHYAEGNSLADVLDAACAEQGFRPEVAVRTEQTATAPLLAASGIGPTLVPASVVPEGLGGWVLSPDPAVQRPLYTYTREQPDPLVTRFETLVAQEARLMPTHVRKRLDAAAGH
jgi:DNA-binding transcriptional LysR family regulator